MTNPFLVLEGVSFILPDGGILFSNLSAQFDLRRTGLVGRNGIGKTVLAQILAGRLAPSTGRCARAGVVHYLSQQASTPDGGTVASLAGLENCLHALSRIEAGSTSAKDFDAVGDRWDIRQRLQQALSDNGLSHLSPDTPARNISGGEAMRVGLIGAMLSAADFLVLDEPSNHLDRLNRNALIAQLERWSKGLLVISHDRQLLATMERIVELSSLGLQSHGGGYAFYAARKAEERENAFLELKKRKLERKRETQAMREQHERQDRRQARDKRQGREANQARILLGRQKERSENSSGKLQQAHAASRDALDHAVREAAQRIDNEAVISLHEIPAAHVPKRVAELDKVELPFVPSATRHISLVLSGRQRVGVVGANGCGKSTLLKLLAGQLSPVKGHCDVHARCAYLDQQLANLSKTQSVIEQMRAANPSANEDTLRMQLAHLGLDAGRVSIPSEQLSGGERLKAALACVLYAETPAQLLLLDEPGNHLDLPSMNALEAMLRSYQGALVIVSHDDVFLDNIELTDRLIATPEGWRMDAYSSSN